jgi:hypothetical protein
MLDSLGFTEKSESRRFNIAVAFVLGALLGGLLTHAYIVNTPQKSGETRERDTVSAMTMERSLPRAIRIPSVEIEAQFEEPLGLQASGEIEVPEAFDTVAWYEHGPTPGELGPAVVLGHVDSYEGPAVFYNIRKLREGDSIFVEREDGTTAEFRVIKLENYDQNDFPTEAVYGDIDHAGLRLITCTGVFDRGTARYTHNLVLFA